MYTCPKCKIVLLVENLDAIRVHLNKHKTLGELEFPVSCLKENCQSDFNSIHHVMRHLRIYHPIMNVNDAIEMEENDQLGSLNDMDTPPATSNAASPDEDFDSVMSSLNESLIKELFSTLLNLRAKASVTFSTTVGVIKTVSNIIQLVMNKVLEAVRNYVHLSADISASPSLLVEKMASAFEKIKKAASVYDSELKIRQSYETHPLFVQPKEIVLSHRYSNKKSCTFLLHFF